MEEDFSIRSCVIDLQRKARYKFANGFKDLFCKITRTDIAKKFCCNRLVLKASLFDTVLGSIVVISDSEYLYLLEFADRHGLGKKVEKLILMKNAIVVYGDADPISMIRQELRLYFSGKLIEFKTPLCLMGTEFQKRVWNELLKISYGQTISYLEQAKAIGNGKAVRAVARANGANQLAIVIPCHRVLNSNGAFGGYSGGCARKVMLINHEKQYVKNR